MLGFYFPTNSRRKYFWGEGIPETIWLLVTKYI
jgi:hypothetical protein